MFHDVYDYDQANENVTGMERAGGSLAVTSDLMCYLTEYARQKPQAMALWCFGIGFVLGWKLKPW